MYDGPTRDSPVLGRHCGNDLPPQYLSSGNQMMVVMRTDGIQSAKGFKALYNVACGARITVSDSGVLGTSATLSLRENLFNCTWILVAEDPGNYLKIFSFSHKN